MNPASRAATLAVLVAAAASVAGCNQPPSADRAHASAATRASCRSRADEVYLKQNRAEIYQADTYATATRDSPYGAAGLPGITTNGLSGRFAREQMEDDCINSTNGDAATLTNPAPRAPSSDIVRGTALPPPRP
jgi:hypothetical protein